MSRKLKETEELQLSSIYFNSPQKLIVIFLFFLVLTVFIFLSWNSTENKPPGLPIDEATQNQLREILKNLRERTATYREKLTDPILSSPEPSPTASKFA